ncbi:hypothetical protein BFJ72_g1089 [Fusarium proliferatum]|uniref:L-asparaginase II n=1 Tax=Gibberella intermedia TaxID=948311 RepID=A0A420U771_GIBIN|nr:hypothetical protein BFJ72_g1089 [Fusarium proliferatum]
MTRTTLLDRDYVVTDRGGIIENTHGVHIAVTDIEGNILFSAGNPSRVTHSRSAAKPAQAVAVIETGAVDKFGFDEIDLALTSGEDDLRCGGHPAVSEEVNREWIRTGFVPTGICNNCSGKHVAMMAGAEALGADVKDYHLPSHPMQLEVKRVVGDLAHDPKQVEWGVDGCNLPAPAYPLFYLAQKYATFADAADAVEASSSTSQRTRNFARVFNTMTKHPEQVGGTGRFCTVLMQTYRGQLFGKVGADASYGIGVRESEDTRRLGVKGALGVAAKIEDGNLEILYAVIPEILEQLGIGTPEQRGRLDGIHHLQRRNTMNEVTGHVRFNFKVRPFGDRVDKTTGYLGRQ